MKIVVKPMMGLTRYYYSDGVFSHYSMFQRDFTGHEVYYDKYAVWFHPSPGIVYVIHFLSGEYKGLCKIGFTADWNTRQKSLRRKYGDFALIHSIKSNNARVAESWMHWRYREYDQGHEIFWIPSFLFPKIRKVTELMCVPRSIDDCRTWRLHFRRTVVEDVFYTSPSIRLTHNDLLDSEIAEYCDVAWAVGL